MEESVQPAELQVLPSARDPLVRPDAILEVRRRPMSERLELALSWNAVVDELRTGLAEVTGSAKPRR
jgi:hypothetical protein